MNFAEGIKLYRKLKDKEFVFQVDSKADQKYEHSFGSTLFFDLDGTLSFHGYNAIPSMTIEALKTYRKRGHKIVLTSARDQQWLDEVKYLLETQGVDIHSTVPLCGRGPRIILNDPGYGGDHTPCYAVPTSLDSYDWEEPLRNILDAYDAKRGINIYEGI